VPPIRPDRPPPDAGPPDDRIHRLRAESPADLLALIPYLLGYHPTESLVMSVVHDRAIALSVRVDLCGDPGRTADRFAGIASSHGADGVLLVAYSADAVLADRYLQPAIAALDGIGVIDALYADGSRWWSRVCSGDCCPPDGVPYAVQTHPLAAEAVLAGMTAWDDRRDIERLVEGPGGDVETGLRDRADRLIAEVFDASLTERRQSTLQFITDYVDRRSAGPAPELGDEDLLRLACQVVDVIVRDEAWLAITRETAWIHVELWQRVVARAVSPLEAGPLCLLGMAAWVAGQGTLQVCCLDRVRVVDPDYTMADLLEDINARAIPPTFWEEIRAGMREALDLQVAAEGKVPVPFTDLIGSPRAGSRPSRRERRRTMRQRAPDH
jgi:hypothetical protein